jgi:DNA-binding MarR family transcriptional regulator
MGQSRVNKATSSRTAAPREQSAEYDEVDRILDQWRTERPDLDPTPMGIFGRVSRVHSLVRMRQTETLAQFGLNLAAFDVLANLRRTGPPFRKTPSTLAASSMLTSGGVTFRLDRLEAQGFIRRVRSDEDRRTVFAELTDEGHQLIDDVMGAHLQVEVDMLAGLSNSDAARLTNLLRALERSVTAAPKATPAEGPGAGVVSDERRE